jgi:hypothetical protein
MAASIENNPLDEEVGLNMRDPVTRLVQHTSPARIFKRTALNGGPSKSVRLHSETPVPIREYGCVLH